MNPHPLHPSLIRPVDDAYPIDVTEHTREVLRRRAEQVHPTIRTTSGRPEWRWGRAVDTPSSSGAPLIMSPSDLEKRGAEAPDRPSIADVVKRLKP